MSGYYMATSECVGCGRVFNYNPMKVPSIRVNGVREPICSACVETANPKRIANGLAPIIPMPDAYEPCSEEEMG